MKTVPSNEKSEVSLGVQLDTPVIAEARAAIEPQWPRYTSSTSIPRLHSESLGHGRLVLSRWDRFLDLVSNGYGRNVIVVNGESLDIASVAAVAR